MSNFIKRILRRSLKELRSLVNPPDRYLKLIPQITIKEFLGSENIVRIYGTYDYIDGSLPTSDAILLLAILIDKNPNNVLEIGTFNGHTTRLMALNMPNSVINTIDLPEDFVKESFESIPKDDFHLIDKRNVGIEYKKDKNIKNIVQHFGDTANWDFSKVNADFFFIDGSHTYEYVRNDTEKAINASKGRPITIVWHDCDESHSGVIRWLSELSASGKPVKRIKNTSLAVMDLNK